VLCGSFTLSAGEKQYTCSLTVPPLSNATASTCGVVVPGALCSAPAGMSLRVVDSSGVTVGVGSPDPLCGGCASVVGVANPTAAPVTYALRASCGNISDDYSTSDSACSGTVQVSNVAVSVNCPYDLQPGGKASCAAGVPANTALSGATTCASGTAAVTLVTPDGATTVLPSCASFTYQAFAAEQLHIQQACPSGGACTGVTRLSLSPLPPACDTFALGLGKKEALCSLVVPAQSSVALANVCWPKCSGNTTVSVTSETGSTHDSGVTCSGACAYMSYSNTGTAALGVLVHQSCAPALSSVCSGRTSYEFSSV
jgi:hypothetical protein